MTLKLVAHWFPGIHTTDILQSSLNRTMKTTVILLLSVLFIIGMDLHNSEKHSIINHGLPSYWSGTPNGNKSRFLLEKQFKVDKQFKTVIEEVSTIQADNYPNYVLNVFHNKYY